MARSTAALALSVMVLFAAAFSAHATRAADFIPISADDAKVMAMRPEMAVKAVKPYQFDLSGAGRAWDIKPELARHVPGHAHPSEKVAPVLSDRSRLDIEGDILAKVRGLVRPANADGAKN